MAGAQSPTHVMVTPNELIWSDMPTLPAGAKVAIIEGPLNEAVPFDKLDRSKTHALSAGSIAVIQPKTNQFSWTEGETIVQVHGIGPLVIHYVNPADDKVAGGRKATVVTMQRRRDFRRAEPHPKTLGDYAEHYGATPRASLALCKSA